MGTKTAPKGAVAPLPPAGRKLSVIHRERCTFDCQLFCSIPVLSVISHGKPSFRPFVSVFANGYMIAQDCGIGKLIQYPVLW